MFQFHLKQYVFVVKNLQNYKFIMANIMRDVGCHSDQCWGREADKRCDHGALAGPRALGRGHLD